MDSKARTDNKLNPRTTHREFFGVVGACGISTLLPAFIILLGLIANEQYSVQGISFDLGRIARQLPSDWTGVKALCFDPWCWAFYLVWFFGFVVLDVVVPGQPAKGVELRDGTQLPYTINGRSVSVIFVLILSWLGFQGKDGQFNLLSFIYENQLKLIMVTIIFSYALAHCVYLMSFVPLRQPNGVGTRERILSVNGNTGNWLYDWFIGRELNPRIGSWDIKLFCELRPGMLLMFLINLSCAYHQYSKYGTVTDSMILVNLLEAFYIFEGILNEDGCLTMIDITTDGFGFMLCFGDLAWLPWSYSLQARYISLPENFVTLGWTKITFIVLLNLLGFYIFHASNQQKSDFKKGKLDHLNLKSISTSTGSKLLCDGWWGYSQHINYFGDWLIGWSWCLTTGFQTPITYFYVFYFGTLLIHRQTRDEAKCRAKYGKQWEEYEQRVPYKIIPYVY